MQFTLQTLSVLAASLLFSTVSAFPQCQPGEAWPDVQDCHNFFECAAGGIPVLKTCGPGTAYCPVTGVCDYEFKIPACRPHGPPHKGPGAEGHEKPQGPPAEEHEQPQGHGDEGHEKPQGPPAEKHEQPQGHGDEGHEQPQGPQEGHERPEGPAQGWPSAAGHHSHGGMSMGH